MRDCEHLVIPLTESPKQVLSRLVHEFRAPITAINGYATLILKDTIDSREAAKEIQRITENMQEVQNAVFDYLRAQSTLE